MLRWHLSFLAIILAAGLVSAQSLTADIEAARSIKLLEATEADIGKLFGSLSPFMYGQKVFSRESSRIMVSYSSGKCNDAESHGVDPDDWNVPEGKAVIIEVLPRERLTVSEIDLGSSVRLRRDRLYRGRSDYHIYYNKHEGVAVTTFGDHVDSIMFFPSSSSDSRLCRDPKIQNYYSKGVWKRSWQPKYACILRNQYANVDRLSIVATGERLFSVKTTATDPENDVLTYNYHVTGGKIIGVGANVTWDLSDASPGSYSISAGVDDGAGIVGKTVTETVTIN